MYNNIKWSVFFIFLITSTISFAKKTKAQKKETTIHWMTIAEVEAAQKIKPKKVYIDVYTDWCGWCKVMDKKTFSNPNVIKYMNDNFYCVHFNSEKENHIMYKGKEYNINPATKTNELAEQWMRNQMSYPTSLLFDEDFTNPQPVPGYLDIPQFEMIVKYIFENKHKTVPFDEYQKKFKGDWK